MVKRCCDHVTRPMLAEELLALGGCLPLHCRHHGLDVVGVRRRAIANTSALVLVDLALLEQGCLNVRHAARRLVVRVGAIDAIVGVVEQRGEARVLRVDFERVILGGVDRILGLALFLAARQEPLALGKELFTRRDRLEVKALQPVSLLAARFVHQQELELRFFALTPHILALISIVFVFHIVLVFLALLVLLALLGRLRKERIVERIVGATLRGRVDTALLLSLLLRLLLALLVLLLVALFVFALELALQLWDVRHSLHPIFARRTFIIGEEVVVIIPIVFVASGRSAISTAEERLTKCTAVVGRPALGVVLVLRVRVRVDIRSDEGLEVPLANDALSSNLIATLPFLHLLTAEVILIPGQGNVGALNGLGRKVRSLVVFRELVGPVPHRAIDLDLVRHEAQVKDHRRPVKLHPVALGVHFVRRGNRVKLGHSKVVLELVELVLAKLLLVEVVAFVCLLVDNENVLVL
mmetsp:Transcript_5817/g.18652  ORF Transcript_5817/g.18652 Transcript_5817/m.18652 type:complete len:469 (+) Transcript_5817:452-1858(+)